MLINFFFRKFEISTYWVLLFQSLLCCLFISGKTVNASEVVAVLEGRQWPYEKALEGLKESCSCSPEVYYLQEISSPSGFKTKVASHQPSLFVAVGSKSLEFFLSYDFNLPVVYSMVLNPWSIVNTESKPLVGVSMNVAPQAYWEAMLHIKPAIQTVGLVYNPAQTQILKDHAERLAKEHGQELIAIPVRNPKESLQAIKKMASQIDAFLMLPDKTLIRQEIVDTLISSSLNNHFVLIGLSDKYVRAGALLAYSFNSESIGKGAGKIVNAILNNTSPKVNNSMWASDIKLTINLKSANKIGVVIDSSLLEKADTIIE